MTPDEIIRRLWADAPKDSVVRLLAVVSAHGEDAITQCLDSMELQMLGIKP